MTDRDQIKIDNDLQLSTKCINAFPSVLKTDPASFLIMRTVDDLVTAFGPSIIATQISASMQSDQFLYTVRNIDTDCLTA